MSVRHVMRAMRVFCLTLVLALLMAGSSCRASDRCSELQPSVLASIKESISTRISLQDPSSLDIKRLEFVSTESCYRRIVFILPSRRASITVFLSPDQRYISSSVIDLQVAAAEEKSRELSRIDNILLADSSPSRGLGKTIIVEFGDLECPACRRLDMWRQQLPQIVRDSIEWHYKYLPIPNHPWAEQAARYAICASRQSNQLFWTLHDYLMKEQANILPAEFDAKARRTLIDGGLDSPKFDLCLKSKEADQVIMRDQELAAEFNVHSTPTLFIDGRSAKIFSFDDLLREVTAGRQTLDVTEHLESKRDGVEHADATK